MEAECTEDVVEDSVKTDCDGAWKSILHAHLKDFMAFFWPEAYEDIDWDKPFEALEQEFQALGLESEIGKRYVDKLFKVYLKGKKESQWILIHVEVMNQQKNTFPKRQFVYYYKIFDEYGKEVASMAILADKSASWHPTEYHSGIWGSSITRKFETVKLSNYKSKKDELLKSKNPFAMVVLIQLEAHETTPHDEARILTKLEFFRALNKKGWPRETIWNMYRFLDTILCLNEENDTKFEKVAKKIEREENMQIMANIERKAYHKGEVKILVNLLNLKFKFIPPEYLTTLESANTENLEKWALNILAADTIDKVFV